MRILPVSTIGFIILSNSFAALAASSNYGKIPLSFEPNRGQADSKTLYLARGNGYLVSLQSSSSRILLRKGGKSAQISSRLVGGNSVPVQAQNGLQQYIRAIGAVGP